MIETRYIDWRAAQIGEAVANGHDNASIGRIYDVDAKVVAQDVGRLHYALGILGMGDTSNHANTRARGTAMLIAGDSLKASDEKIPRKPYVPTQQSGTSWVRIKNTKDYPPHPYNPNFIQPSRGTARRQDIVLTAEMLTYLSYATWGASIESTSKAYALYDDPGRATRRARYVIKQAYDLLDANDMSEAIAHASFWGALPIDQNVLDPDLKEPPEPIVFERGVTIQAKKFAHRLPPEPDYLNWQYGYSGG